MFISSCPLITDELTPGTSISTFSFWAVKQNMPSHARFIKRERTYAAAFLWKG